MSSPSKKKRESKRATLADMDSGDDSDEEGLDVAPDDGMSEWGVSQEGLSQELSQFSQEGGAAAAGSSKGKRSPSSDHDGHTSGDERQASPPGRRRKRLPNRVNDFIHGFIRLPGLLMHIMDTPQFKRTGCIKQLGACHSVFPGAHHTRSEHMMGVAHLAGKLIRAICDKQKQWKRLVTETDILCVMVAGLCHDLGHGPFSHAFEVYMKDHPCPETGKPFTHEEIGVKMFDHLLDANGINLALYGLNEQDRIFIKECIKPPPRSQRQGGRDNREWLYDIVNNTISGFDVDKLDYFERDPHMCNVEISTGWATNMLIEEARVYKGRFEEGGQKVERWTICFPTKRIGAALKWFRTRAELHKTIYTVRHVKQIELMHCDVLKACGDRRLILGPRTNDNPDGMYAIHEAAYNMQAYTNLTDEVLTLIKNNPDPELDHAKDLLYRIETRQLYKLVGHTPLIGTDEDKYHMAGADSRSLDRTLEREVLEAIISLGQPSYAEPNGHLAAVAEGDERQEEEQGGGGVCSKRKEPDGGGGCSQTNGPDGGGSSCSKRKGPESSEEGATKKRRVLGLVEDDIIVEINYVHYGMKDKNPVDQMRFWKKDAKADSVATNMRESAYRMECPKFFDDRQVRVYCKTPEKTRLAQCAFKKWKKDYIRRGRQPGEEDIANDEEEDDMDVEQEVDDEAGEEEEEEDDYDV